MLAKHLAISEEVANTIKEHHLNLPASAYGSQVSVSMCYVVQCAALSLLVRHRRKNMYEVARFFRVHKKNEDSENRAIFYFHSHYESLWPLISSSDDEGYESDVGT